MSAAHNYCSTHPVILKIGYVTTSLIIVTVASVAYSKAVWIDIKGECPIWTCPAVWMAQVGLAFVILPVFFAVAMLIGLVVPQIKHNMILRRVDHMGHIANAFFSIIGFVGLTTYVILALIYFPCKGDLTQEKEKAYCLLFREHQGEIFEPIVFFMGAVLSLFNAILALYVSSVAKKATKPPRTTSRRMLPGHQSNSYSVSHI